MLSTGQVWDHNLRRKICSGLQSKKDVLLVVSLMYFWLNCMRKIKTVGRNLKEGEGICHHYLKISYGKILWTSKWNFFFILTHVISLYPNCVRGRYEQICDMHHSYIPKRLENLQYGTPKELKSQRS